MIKKVQVSVIIPTYNEESRISNCLKSLLEQSLANKIEILVIDDGSTDSTTKRVQEMVSLKPSTNIRLISQTHSGPGVARNLGAKNSKGSILVFLDADMVFDKDFIEKLSNPIITNNIIGTSTINERFANPENYWAKCWNIGRFAAVDTKKGNPFKNIILNKKNNGGIFRAINKKYFKLVGGFETDGDYSDDETLSKKLGLKAVMVKDAILYHYNPSTFSEVFERALWIGSGRHFTGTFSIKILNLIKFSPPIALIKALVIATKYKYLGFICFKIIYDTAVWISVIKSIL